MKKKIACLLVIVMASLLAVWLPTHAQNAEDAAIRRTIEHYFKGHATGDGEHFKKAFHPEAKLWWVRDGQAAQLTSAEYIARASGKPPADEAQRKRTIASVDISGNAAVVKVILDYPTTRFTDYMSMLKTNGEWKIVNKTYVSQPKARS